MKSTLFLVSLLTIGTITGGKSEKLCNKPADIVFVLDESGSIYGPDFKKQLDFVQNVIETFSVGFNKTHIGVMAFSTENRIIFRLGEYTEEQDLKNAVKGIKQNRGNTNTHLALKSLREEMFSRQYTRPWVDQVAIVITDGDSDYSTETAREAKLCHGEHFQMFAIGVGKAVSQRELEAIASSPDLVFTVSNYGALESLRIILAGMACATPTTPPPPTTTPDMMIEGCTHMDHIWSISDQAGVEETDLALEFIKDVTRDLTIDRIHVQAGLAPRFCDEGSAIRLKDHDTHEGFWRALDKRRLSGLRIERTLEYMRTQGFSSSNGVRSDTVKYGILIVDNRFDNWDQTEWEVAQAKKAGVRLIVIGVGGRVQEHQLRELASSSEDYTYFVAENYGKLTGLKIKVIQEICKKVPNTRLNLRQFFERYYN